MPLTPNVLPRLLPKNVVAVELCDDVTEILYPEEEHFIARAVNKRVREFTTVRACARLALERLVPAISTRSESMQSPTHRFPPVFAPVSSLQRRCITRVLWPKYSLASHGNG